MGDNAMALEVQRGMVRRDDFGAQQLQSNAETSLAAVTAREQARIQAAYIMAERHPRDWDGVRVRLMRHCQRYGFAYVARYAKPVGSEFVNGEWVEKKATGLSTQFAQVARQEMGNVHAETSVAYEDDLMRIIRVTVVDYERNTHESRELAIAKTVEKKGRYDKAKKKHSDQPPDGREIISTRVNTNGEKVFVCRATDDEVTKKQNSEISKAQRDCTLRMIPKDIRDDAEAKIIEVLEANDRTDPSAARKKIVDAFARLGVMPEDLVTYVGCPLDRVSPGQLQEMRDLWAAINENETTFQEALRAKYETADAGGKTPGDVAEQKIAALSGDKPADAPKPADASLSGADEKLKADMDAFDKREAEVQKRATGGRKFDFGGKR